MILISSFEPSIQLPLFLCHAYFIHIDQFFSLPNLLILVTVAALSRFSFLILFLGSSCNLQCKQLPCCSSSILSSTLATSGSPTNCFTLEDGGAAVKDKNRLDAEVKEFADSAEEAHYMRVAKRVSFFVANGFKELVYPNTGVDC